MHGAWFHTRLSSFVHSGVNPRRMPQAVRWNGSARGASDFRISKRSVTTRVAFASLETLVSEVKRGCEHQAAAGSLKGPLRFQGKVYPDLRALIESAECLVSQGVFCDRVQRLGWAIERALTEPQTGYELLGETYATLQELCKHPLCKYDVETVLRRLKKGCCPEEAIGIWKAAFMHNNGKSLVAYIKEIEEDAERRIREVVKTESAGWSLETMDGQPITIKNIKRDTAARIEAAKREDAVWQLAQRSIDERRARQYGVPLPRSRHDTERLAAQAPPASPTARSFQTRRGIEPQPTMIAISADDNPDHR